jgi:tRNA 2-thiouridine synthesizing protein A
MSSAGELNEVLLDLRGEICPFTFVRCKLALEQLPTGQQLHVLVDNVNATKNVPRSLRDWGQQVISVAVVQWDHDGGPQVWKIVVVRSS